MPVHSRTSGRTAVMFTLSIIFLIVGLFFFFCSPVSVQGSSGDIEQKIVRAVKRVLPGVVNITTGRPGYSRTGVGSGVIINKDGFILTNAHVLKNASIIKVTLSDDTTYSAMIWRASAEKDLALLKVEATNLPVPKFGDSDQLELGQIVIAIGNPYKFKWTVTQGVISALNREVNARGIKYTDLIQTDAAINKGSSGGALINTSGEVIGINTLVYTGTSDLHAQGLSFAIPANYALEIARELMSSRKAGTPKPWLGISGKSITELMKVTYELVPRYGVYITQVSPNSPAAKAKIQPGDVIVKAKGQLIRGVKDLKNVLHDCIPGQRIEIILWRKNKKITTTAIIDQLSQ
ncbi:MAG: trypsin-like peptidase domain-containing protein [Candidatus Eremiobacteraeota bacterium]|nr:trypsin-like peptidase domain-containing protein [Candidatus Eremiobacteraeota bacterium]